MSDPNLRKINKNNLEVADSLSNILGIPVQYGHHLNRKTKNKNRIFHSQSRVMEKRTPELHNKDISHTRSIQSDHHRRMLS